MRRMYINGQEVSGTVPIDNQVTPNSQHAVSASAVNNALTEYSKNIYNFDEEIIIGYAVQNGIKKPIYRKIVPYVRNGSFTISNCDLVFNANIMYNSLISGMYYLESGNNETLNRNGDTFTMISNGNTATISKNYIIIEYTKTTD